MRLAWGQAASNECQARRTRFTTSDDDNDEGVSWQAPYPAPFFCHPPPVRQSCSVGLSSACSCLRRPSSPRPTTTRCSEVRPWQLPCSLPAFADLHTCALTVDRQANDATIKKAYRKIAKANHPDKNKDPAAQQKFADASNGTRVDPLAALFF